ncbi:MAG: hypothetical protein JJU31_06605 [Wenzhouxiangella sp.]|nr:hypothetical protein [Wenzhouxiangella sp.]MCH8477248.1 iron-sulfur cluster assembly protein [Wenzhouxiangella sp.]TVR93446.1 MAG: hypothetical protein EA418_12060 [Wenzhouxiangellaceae bacterium]
MAIDDNLPAEARPGHAPGAGIRTSIGLLLLVGGLYVGSQGLTELTDRGIGALCILLALPICWTSFWRARVRRRAFRDFYLTPDGSWHRWIRGGIVMLGTRLLIALALALLLVIGLARLEGRAFWVVLLVTALLWPLSYTACQQLVARQANLRFHRLLATRMHMAAWFAVLLLLLVALAFFEPVPDVRGLSLDEAVMRFTLGYPAQSQALDWGLVASEALRALPHWLIQNLGQSLPSQILSWLAWALVLLREWLFAWPLLLLFQAGQDMLDAGIRDRLREAGLTR